MTKCVALWSPKGGSGTTVTAAALALAMSEERHTTLIDASPGADLADVLGMHAGIRNGEMRDVTDRLNLATPASSECLALDDTSVVYDLGNALSTFASEVLRPDPTVVYRNGAYTPPVPDAVLCVIRADYLALNRALRYKRHLDLTAGVILVTEQSRALSGTEVAQILGKPVISTVQWSPSVHRTIDAGVLVVRQPFELRAPMRRLVEQLAPLEAVA